MYKYNLSGVDFFLEQFRQSKAKNAHNDKNNIDNLKICYMVKEFYVFYQLNKKI